MRQALFALLGLLALTCVPTSSRAEMPGEPCGSSQVGATKLDDSQKNIIACLKTDDSTNGAVWSAMSGSGGITGGCKKTIGIKGGAPLKTGPLSPQTTYYTDEWGKGCKNTKTYIPAGTSYQAVDGGPEPGYACGQFSLGMETASEIGAGTSLVYLACVKN